MFVVRKHLHFACCGLVGNPHLTAKTQILAPLLTSSFHVVTLSAKSSLRAVFDSSRQRLLLRAPGVRGAHQHHLEAQMPKANLTQRFHFLVGIQGECPLEAKRKVAGCRRATYCSGNWDPLD